MMSQVDAKKGAAKIIASIVGLFLLLVGVIMGILFIDQDTEIRIGAYDCKTYVFNIENNGKVTVRNGSTKNERGQTASVYINGKLVNIYNVPSLVSGTALDLGHVEAQSNQFEWKVEGSRDCANEGSYPNE